MVKINIPTLHPDDPKGSCGSPGRDPSASESKVAPGTFQRVTNGNTDGMKLISGGEFLMGNEGDYGFPANG